MRILQAVVCFVAPQIYSSAKYVATFAKYLVVIFHNLYIVRRHWNVYYQEILCIAKNIQYFCHRAGFMTDRH